MLNGLFGFMRKRKPALYRSLHRMRLARLGRDEIDAALKQPRLIDEIGRRLNDLARSEGKSAEFDVMATDAKSQPPILDWLWSKRDSVLRMIVSRLSW